MPPLPPIARLGLRAVAWASALVATALLCLPLLLALLMLLFDNTAQALLVLVGGIARWIGAFLPSGGALPAYRSLSIDPVGLALGSAARMAPCVLGLAASLSAPARRAGWLLAAACWTAAGLFVDRIPACALLFGIVPALLLAIDAGRRPAA